ncbi:MAG: carboxypeptidase-like regulatory domain-containing protein [candidate division WOR-3 bacterium]|nr:carboxypeptidase-like regulatory domain-containing protein [candidate division WOR-3 bacterium]
MKILPFFLLLFLLLSNCINAPRNNKYDPDNPNKSEISGTIFEPDSLTVSNVILNLVDQNGNIVRCDTSDNSGNFTLRRIDPGIYTITAKTEYYKDVIIENESLWAGTKLTNYGIFFTTFHFEDDEINTVPYGFTRISGDWCVKADNKNYIYRGSDSDDDEPAISLFRNRTSAFKFELMFRVLPNSGQNWETGILLWYQDKLNCYRIKITKSLAQYSLVKNGVETNLYTKSIEITEGTFHNLKAVHTGDALIIYLDEIFLFPASLISLAFENGYWGIYVFNHNTNMTTSIDFDDIYLKIP